jgi:hypothetical protein
MTCSRFDIQKKTTFGCKAYLVLPPKGFSQKVIKGNNLEDIGTTVTNILKLKGGNGPIPTRLSVSELIGQSVVSSNLAEPSRYQPDDDHNFYFDVNTTGPLKDFIGTLQNATHGNMETKSILTFRYGNTVLSDLLTAIWNNAPKIVLGLFVLLIAAALLSEDPSAYLPTSMRNALSTSTTTNKFAKGAMWWRDNVHLYEDNQPNQQNRRNRPPNLVDQIRSGVEQARGPLKNPSLLFAPLDFPNRKMIDFSEPQGGTLADLKGVSTQNQAPANRLRNPRRPSNQLPLLGQPPREDTA